MVEISEALSKSKDITTETFAQIITSQQTQTDPVDDELPPDWLTISPLIDLHVQTVIAGRADVDISKAFDSVSPICCFRRIPPLVRSYGLIHDDSNASGLSFPSPMNEIGGAGAKTDGTAYQIINDSDWFDVNNFVMAMHLYLPATASGDAIKTIIEKAASFGIQIDAHATAANQIRCSVTVSSSAKEVTFTYTPNTWFTLIFLADATNLTVWKDNVQAGQIATGAAHDTNANNVGIWGTASGTQLMKSGCKIALLTFGDKAINSTWRGNYHTDKTLDWEGAATEEITTYPYLGLYLAEPASHSGFFYG